MLFGGMASAQEAVSPLAVELRQLLQQPPPEGDVTFNWGELHAFYSTEQYQPVWLAEQGPNQRARLLLDRLRHAEREGLEPQFYRLDLIEPLWASRTPSDRLRLELLLSSTFFSYAHDVRGGRLEPQQVSPLWHIPRTVVDAEAILRRALRQHDFGAALDGLAPNHPAYRRLRRALAHYRQIQAFGGWPTLPAGPALKQGIRSARVAILRRHLFIEGDLNLPASKGGTRFDEALTYAVRRFQVRHGLHVDGVVGRATLKALNVPVGERIVQITLNMERWRWLPRSLGWRYIIVNIPAYQLIAYEGEKAKLAMPVIIGTPERPTPVVSGKLFQVVLNPYWTVPRSIALRDVIPRQRRNPDYMSKYKIRVFSSWKDHTELEPQQIDWSKVTDNYYPYMLRQDPGPMNPLGKAKFMFYNEFEVYLHDTPNDSLFAASTRAYSSGCIRLEEPMRLIRFLLAGEKKEKWSESRVQSVIRGGVPSVVPLSVPVPVYLLYLTVWVGEDGAVHFSRDVYGEDELVTMCLPDGEPNP